LTKNVLSKFLAIWRSIWQWNI